MISQLGVSRKLALAEAKLLAAEQAKAKAREESNPPHNPPSLSSSSSHNNINNNYNTHYSNTDNSNGRGDSISSGTSKRSKKQPKPKPNIVISNQGRSSTASKAAAADSQSPSFLASSNLWKRQQQPSSNLHRNALSPDSQQISPLLPPTIPSPVDSPSTNNSTRPSDLFLSENTTTASLSDDEQTADSSQQSRIPAATSSKKTGKSNRSPSRSQAPRNRLRRREGHPQSAVPTAGQVQSQQPLQQPSLQQQGPPTTTKFGSAGRPPSRVESSPFQLKSPIAKYSEHFESSISPKPKSFAKRFFSFSTQAPSSPSTSHPRDDAATTSTHSISQLGHRPSVRRSSATAAESLARPSLDSATVGSRVSSRNLESAIDCEESETFSHKVPNRHSIAFPTPNIPENAQSLVSPGALDYLQTSGDGHVAIETGVAVASSLHNTADLINYRREPKTVGRAARHAPETQQHPSLSLSTSTISTKRQQRTERLGGPGQDSRPSSRQSIDPPSPSHSPLGLRRKSSSTAPSFTEPMSTTGVQSSTRGESGHHPSQSNSSRDGMFCRIVCRCSCLSL